MRDLPSQAEQLARDRTWLERLRADDRDALEAIYSAYFQPLWRFAARTIGPDAAEDTVHDVFLALWQRRTSLQPETQLAPYLFTAVRRRMVDTIRHDHVEEKFEQSLASTSATLSQPPLLPDEATALHELTTTLDQVLNKLPERNRTLMTLRWVHGMTYEQIASVLGISKDAAKKQGRRLQQLLTPLLDRFRDHTPDSG